VQTVVLAATRVVQATPRTRLLTLSIADQPFAFSAGQAVYAGLADGTVRRPYSIASSPTSSRASAALELLVQIDDHSHLERVVEGTPVRVEGPFGSFGLPLPIAERHVLFIAGGTGIAPLRAMLGELQALAPAVRSTLFYSARSPQEFAFRDELEALVARQRLTLHLTVTRDQDSPWTGARGRFGRDQIVSALTADTRCVVCGPPALVTDSIALLKAAGVSEERIGWEAF
jgi:ferredoxin-NADP reductase